MTNRSTSRELDWAGVEPATVIESAPAPRRRVFTLGIWSLALGYFAFYAPYSALVRTTSSRALAEVDDAGSRVAMVLAAGLATAIVSTLIVTALGWWRHAERRTVLGVHVLWPARPAFLTGLATAVIIYTTTLMYSFRGVSIVLAMLLMRAGVLMLAPMVDTVFKRRVRWFSWTAFGLSLLALAAVGAELPAYHLTWALAGTVGAYIGAYAVRLQCMNRLAKSGDRNATCRYFVEEQMVAMGVLVVTPMAIALSGPNRAAVEVGRGLASLVSAGALGTSLLIGALYACLYWFGTSIYLDRRENTFCIALNRCASVLAVVGASYGIALAFGVAGPNAGELTAAALIAAAMLFLSPLHHLRVRRFEAPAYQGWIVYRRSPSAPSPYAVNAAER
jgi:hypothetical protein